jgi:hypothetical protein
VKSTHRTTESTGCNDVRLTEELARRVMGWGSAPGRFLKSERRWIPRWRFQPTERLVDAFHLLEKAAPEEYSMSGDNKGNFRVRVQIGGRTGEAHGTSKPRTITYAVALAIGLGVGL